MIYITLYGQTRFQRRDTRTFTDIFYTLQFASPRLTRSLRCASLKHPVPGLVSLSSTGPMSPQQFQVSWRRVSARHILAPHIVCG